MMIFDGVMVVVSPFGNVVVIGLLTPDESVIAPLVLVMTVRPAELT